MASATSPRRRDAIEHGSGSFGTVGREIDVPTGVLHAADDVSFSVDRGETLCIVGESGCGKTITALAIMGLLPRSARRVSGRLVLEGANLPDLDNQDLAALRGERMGMIFQDPMTSLNPYLRIATQVTEPLRLHMGMDRQRALKHAIRALGEVGIPIVEAQKDSILQSNRISFDPIPMLEDRLNIKTIVTYSTFYVIRHQLATYGAMGFSKEAIEKYTLESGKSHHSCIRAGLFESQSSRGIKLLLRKSAKNPENLKDPLLKSYFAGKSSKEGIKEFEEGIFRELELEEATVNSMIMKAREKWFAEEKET